MLVLVVVAAGLAATVALVRSPGPGTGPAGLSPSAWLARYEQPDGRVVRLDQGGDTVSEGQAYAMLLAVAAGNRSRFDAAWTWAANHLMNGQGLLAWRWDRGKVVDSQPAADADLEAAWALHLGAGAFGAPSYDRAAGRLARAVKADETATWSGGPVLVAGPWARQAPATVDPSYLNPEAAGAMAALSGGAGGWRQLGSDDRRLLDAVLSGSGSSGAGQLPPDWVRIDNGSLQSLAQPGAGPGSGRYGLDAQRIPVMLAASCDPADRHAAAALWPALSRLADGGADISYGLDGSRQTSLRNPVGLVAAASSAAAAGDIRTADSLLGRADRLAASDHTYYGDAWAALGRVLLTTTTLSPCPQLSSS